MESFNRKVLTGSSEANTDISPKDFPLKTMIQNMASNLTESGTGEGNHQSEGLVGVIPGPTLAHNSLGVLPSDSRVFVNILPDLQEGPSVHHHPLLIGFKGSTAICRNRGLALPLHLTSSLVLRLPFARCHKLIEVNRRLFLARRTYLCVCHILPNIEMLSVETAYRSIMQFSTIRVLPLLVAGSPLPSKFDLVFRLSRGTSAVTAPHPLALFML